MAESESQKSNTGMALIVGGLVVAVLVMGYFFLGGKLPGQADQDVDVQITLPKVEIPSN